MKTQNNYNPDVLSCLANLSSDEVFTPPKLANEILDLLPKEIWRDKNATFLDPVSKSGVFLREIAKRLLEGLEDQIPDKQKRIDHIFDKQIFGIGITELTALLSRRSLYCSKNPNRTEKLKYSVTDVFDNEQGNIFFDKTNHTWQNGRCSFCGASQSEYEREEGLETHAYQFIHNKLNDKIKNMKFDVIIGNPPYQISDQGHGASAIPIYQKFIEQAKKLNPRFLTMIIPSRWFSGGKGLDEFRSSMLNDARIKELVDYFDSTECFPGVDISGGICYFLWERDYHGSCNVTSIQKGETTSIKRPLLENDSDTFIRFNKAISILRKIRENKEKDFINFVSSRKPFGIGTTIKPSKKSKNGYIKIYSYPENGFIDKNVITHNYKWVKDYKVYTAKAYGERGALPYKIIAKPFLGEKNSCCSETYLVIGPFATKEITQNVIAYMNTKFFRFMVLLKKNTQNAARGVYSFVPVQDFSEAWTDEKLYKKYKLTKEEIEFIESMIRPMN
ncbi:MAG: Eco57I restriction-modification methylase domain-containing protein [Parcubacteria group bacterium]|nr:Eco57I restriction-modification methylase domain-containing protein [Parcubacteria group bacterium]